jgi:hypothetical protein
MNPVTSGYTLTPGASHNTTPPSRRECRMDRRRKSFILIASVILGLATSGSYALAELSVAPPQAQPTLSVSQPQPPPTVTVAKPEPQPSVTVSSTPSSPPNTTAPTPQPTATPSPPQAEPALQPAASAQEVQPAAATSEVQPAATAREVQPAAGAPEVQPAATTPEVQPAATATPPVYSSAPSSPETPINPSNTVVVTPPSPTPPAPSTSAPPSTVGETVAKDAAGNADVPANAAKKVLHSRASAAGRTLRTSDSAVIRSQAAKDLPRFGKAAKLADKAAAGATILGAASGAATDYQGQRAADHSPADSAGYATARQVGGEAGAVAASALCVPADAVSLGLAEAGCLLAGNGGGNLAGGWIYDLARQIHSDTAGHSNSNAHAGTPNANTTIQFVLPL